MKILRLIAAFAAAAVSAAPAAALDNHPFLIRTAGDLATLCSATSNSKEGVAAIHMCEGYLVGVHQFHTAIMPNTATGKLYCIPEKRRPSRNEIAAEFANWVRSSPDMAKHPAIEAVIRWAVSRFPCS